MEPNLEITENLQIQHLTLFKDLYEILYENMYDILYYNGDSLKNTILFQVTFKFCKNK